jgi:tetratricopeptide (TPR) repeat protein
MNRDKNTVNVVLNFHKGDQKSARMLLELLMSVEEGIECKYFLQYGNNVDTITISDTVLRFMDEKDAAISTELPDIRIPQEMIDNDPNLPKYEGNHAVRNRTQKASILQWNLCLYKYINMLDSFLMIEPDCVIQKRGWLRDIHEAWLNYSGPVFGHLKKGLIKKEYIPTHWAGCSVYDSAALRHLPLLHYFKNRYENPWWKYRNEEGTETANNCFYGPVISGYDVSYDYFLFALYWREKTGTNDPYQWPLKSLEGRSDLIFCDFKTKMTADDIFQKFAGKLPLMHGVKDDAVREMMTKYFYTGFGKSGSKKYSLGGRINNPLKDNNRALTIRDLKNEFQGQRCFIIGNGPSLRRTDMSLLKNEYTIGLNRIYLNYENMGFEPTFHCVVNPCVIEQFARDIDVVQSIKFIRGESKRFIKNRWNTFFMESYGVHDFNTDLEDLHWCEGWTVTYCAMQVAFYLGFHTVILIGVDHNFPDSGDPNKLVTADGSDQNHFHPDYFGKGVKWHYPDLERSEKSYAVAKAVYEKNGRRILDATIGGKLTVFPKVDYNSIVSASVNDETPLSLNKRGEELYNSGDLSGARDAFLKAVEIAPGYATAYNNLGVILWQAGDVGKAAECFTKALHLDPDDRSVVMNCGQLLASVDNKDESRKLYAGYLDRHPRDAEISKMLLLL